MQVRIKGKSCPEYWIVLIYMTVALEGMPNQTKARRRETSNPHPLLHCRLCLIEEKAKPTADTCDWYKQGHATCKISASTTNDDSK